MGRLAMRIGVILAAGCSPVPPEVDANSGSRGMTSTAAGTTEDPAQRPSTSTGPVGAGGTSGGSSSTTSAISGLDTNASSSSTSTSGADESSSSSGAIALPTCNEKYGNVPEYILCEELPDRCRFSALTDGSNCDAMCDAFMGLCLDAFDNEQGQGEECVATERQDDCFTNRTTEICVCSR